MINNIINTFIILRGDIRIEIHDGLITVGTLSLRSQKIKKHALQNMFIGIKGEVDNQRGAMIIDLYKRVN